ncbi:hypothetical protein [Marinobacterium aestuarii]|uniref:hypothetical protein n=1 Tax=Marinobacterium aestuarii TaxID=1821621 RepID=UPI0012FF74A6|nr:hypothetical protein [Marinobacterium aestuarii]
MKKLLIVLFVSTLFMELLSQVFFRSDPIVSNIEEWAVKQEEVISNIGMNIIFDTRGKTTVNASRTRPEYRIYKFSISGSKGDGFLVVEVFGEDNMVIKSLIVD